NENCVWIVQKYSPALHNFLSFNGKSSWEIWKRKTEVLQILEVYAYISLGFIRGYYQNLLSKIIRLGLSKMEMKLRKHVNMLFWQI
uniref:Uncharacterized protein n=1 Tax=Periophthalmus magnuspinnatus TaxID=409849 RepID=A0A3B3Z7R5_9GOBI